MQITIHRGTKEVGGTCIELAAGKTRIILDIGLPLFNQDRTALDSWGLRRKSKEDLVEQGILPRVPGLFDEGPSPDAILLSHAHMDHTGLLDRSSPEIPIYATSGTSKMMLAGSLFAMQVGLPKDRHKQLKPMESVTIGDFTVTPFPVDHSIYGCVALLIEADGKSLLYSGDLRLHGRKPGMAISLLKFFEERELDVLLMEGTHLGLPDGEKTTEYQLEKKIVNLVQDAKGLVLASFSPQHLDRLVGFIRAAIQTGRTFVADAYTAVVLHLISSETPVPVPGKNVEFPVYFPNSLWNNGNKRKLLAEKFPHLLTNKIEIETILENPEKFLMVFRPSMLELDFKNKLPEQMLCLHSRWEGYLEEPEWQKTNKLVEQANGKLVQIHTSGHILSEDITNFVEALNPKQVIPVHTFEPEEFGKKFENARILMDGEKAYLQ